MKNIVKGRIALIIIILILLADQTLKIWVKTHMFLGEEIHFFGKYGMLHFIENNGMAFGMEIGGNTGKILLSIFRIAAIICIGWYLSTLIKKNAHTGLIISVSAILAGAIGNFIDSAFYGLIFSESTYDKLAVLFPPEGGYSSFLKGKVVDMFYFPIINTTWPEWSPIKPGESFIFFRPVFNISDAAITCGVFSIIIFQKKMFKNLK
ncbi:MAG TPA: lipoprotein signal peptidase [Bacteroidales bacterium]|nr:lipoprotein signal peptidase [Bacteroidales bacterium]HOU96076.1 lipoprotein signal peptidase [Bacteroidales bacterium]HQG36963.1 lipoprotein signal peptidase [Bacteroidales bacterium]HQG52199.1 lipoprotein signal peptidase [Bacteroidales bacterium]HQJ19985.1 lipoprotein signal peptidase [Bacteroidales bacterium]